MDILTAATVLEQQAQQLLTSVSRLTDQTAQVLALANQVNSISDVNPQIKAFCASMDVISHGVTSQEVIVQQAIDALAGLVN